jgi:DNA-binding XRE family transcriptional regulator
MANKKTEARKLAEMMYLYEEKTQKEIAEQLGIAPKTMNLWASEDSWKEKKENVKTSPERNAQKLNTYINNLYKLIDDRDGIPTPKEADTIIKLTSAQQKLRLVPSQIFQATTQFMDYLQYAAEGEVNKETMQILAKHFQHFMERKISEYGAT